MKNSFFLYFLVLSPLIFGQNSLQYNIKGYKYASNYYTNNGLITNLSTDLILIDKKLSNAKRVNWGIDESTETLNENEFSSLLLIKQLEDLNNSTPFNVVHNPTLERFIRVYLKNRRENLSNLMGKAKYYFPMFEEHLDKYNLPLEIKYLAIVESALMPDAISSAGAKGLWQFMLGTGKEYGLEINSYVDERYDRIKSTEAACKYLSNLYKIFKDWDLALAAYNSGSGNVKKAILRSGGKQNYWEIRQFLPRETRSYVPAFYATFYIFEYAKILQLKPNYSELTYFEVDTVQIKSSLDFNTIQKRTSIKIKLLKDLNPQYKKEYIPYSKNKLYVLTLPKNLIPKFIENERFFYQTSLQNKSLYGKSNSIKITELNSYKVEQGDNLKSIAVRHQITLEQLKKWNGLQTNYLIEGQRLVVTKSTANKIVISSKTPPDLTTNYLDIKDQNIHKNYETYIVKEGDTLFNISRRYLKVSVEELRDWNQINNLKFLKPGTKLKIFKS